MNGNPGQWLVFHIKKMVNSIAFYPAVMALFFLVLSDLMIRLDFSEFGKQIKSDMEWLKLKDASTARTIISVIAAGILSLTVFSFTMVMVILNQAASQMSNRVLDRLIGNRYQQIVLGFYIGTIVYSLFLLSAIRDIDSGIYVPSLSTYLLIAFAIIDIFFFLYFLHYITQSVKYAVIIRRIHRQTAKSLKASCGLTDHPPTVIMAQGEPLLSSASGIFEGFNKDKLLRLAQNNGFIITFLYPPGSFVLCNTPIANVQYTGKEIENDLLAEIKAVIHINAEQSILENYYYGFQQLSEVAIKALSPGINDPGTAIESLRALADLLSFRILHFPNTSMKDEEGTIRIVKRELDFEELFNRSVIPIWHYGKNDPFIQKEMQHVLEQLQMISDHPVFSKLLIMIKQHRESF